MSKYFSRFFIVFFLSTLMLSCATPPQQPDPIRLADAKRFLHSWGAGELAMAGFNRALDGKPAGYVELAHRAFADVTPADFEDIAAKVYARHLSQKSLAGLANFAESPTGNHFFKVTIANAVKGKAKKRSNREILKQFNADELTKIMKFVQSDAYAEMKTELPTINRELGKAGKKLGETKMREYINQH